MSARTVNKLFRNNLPPSVFQRSGIIACNPCHYSGIPKAILSRPGGEATSSACATGQLYLAARQNTIGVLLVPGFHRVKRVLRGAVCVHRPV